MFYAAVLAPYKILTALHQNFHISSIEYKFRTLPQITYLGTDIYSNCMT